MSSEEMPTVKGQLCPKMFCFEWKIPDCHALIHETYETYQSPIFDSFDETWAFRICTEQNKMRIQLLVKERTIASENSYKISIMMTNGIEYTSVEGTKFVPAKKYYVSNKFIDLTEHDLSKNCVTEDNILTVSCIITHNLNNHCTGISKKSKMSSKWDVDVIHIKKEDSETSQEENDNEEEILSGSDELSEDFKDLLISGKDSDITIKVKDQEFKVHRIIIQARSSIFAANFKNSEIILHITDCDPGTFHRFLMYLYSGKVEKMSSDELLDLYRMADKYSVKLLKEKCIKLMISNLSVDNFCDVMTLALLYKESSLKESATSFFTTNACGIIHTVQWTSFQKENLEEGNKLFSQALCRPK